MKQCDIPICDIIILSFNNTYAINSIEPGKIISLKSSKYNFDDFSDLVAVNKDYSIALKFLLEQGFFISSTTPDVNGTITSVIIRYTTKNKNAVWN